jgi:hypothetical protein
LEPDAVGTLSTYSLGAEVGLLGVEVVGVEVVGVEVVGVEVVGVVWVELAVGAGAAVVVPVWALARPAIPKTAATSEARNMRIR